MDYPQQIEKLLNKYWEGQTSIEEERELRQYFELHSSHADATTAYFLMLSGEGEIEAPFTPELPQQAKTRPMWVKALSIAASVLLIVFAGVAISKYSGVTTQSRGANTYVVDDPDEAYEQARQALLLVSQKMNQSQVKASSQVDKVTPYTTILK